MADTGSAPRPDRHPGDTYEDILSRDSRPVPAYLREGPVPEVGVAGWKIRLIGAASAE